jgi:cytochrome P450
VLIEQHTAVGSQAIRDHRVFQQNEGKLLTQDLLDRPDEYVFSIERYSVSVVSIIGWGRRINRINDPVAQTALAIMEGVDLVVPCNQITEVLPSVIRLPSWIWSYPSVCKAQARRAGRFFYLLSSEAVNRGENYAQRLLAAQADHGLSNEEIASLTSNLIGGGVDTTSSTIITFILAMCVFPEAQRKAHEELDGVIGLDRSPSIDDRESLPYVNAVVSEALRWRTVTILGGIPHAPIHDDEYRGYHIPKGTGIYGNIWAIHRHPREFPDPDNFRPERFVNGVGHP